MHKGALQRVGLLEAARGRPIPISDGFVLALRSDQFANDARVEQSWREFDLRDGSLRYSHKMQTADVPALTHHVEAGLRRSPVL
ncbi:MAG TPA: heme-binding beta-barrel domain-containing protein [Anaerolineaceae bacterium]|nr:heme-binding beta-barrel domain-containing protein [Anaerolineaceae bacterium]